MVSSRSWLKTLGVRGNIILKLDDDYQITGLPYSCFYALGNLG